MGDLEFFDGSAKEKAVNVDEKPFTRERKEFLQETLKEDIKHQRLADVEKQALTYLINVDHIFLAVDKSDKSGLRIAGFDSPHPSVKILRHLIDTADVKLLVEICNSPETLYAVAGGAYGKISERMHDRINADRNKKNTETGANTARLNQQLLYSRIGDISFS